MQAVYFVARYAMNFLDDIHKFTGCSGRFTSGSGPGAGAMPTAGRVWDT